ncbi:DUF4261 domain-containing protein [Paenibacillus sp. NAIST15-1]|uniref:DUF4261 domain-containing protein n=1 Tax=Paenibacillus sp. NAIST15-1 TaxID=1605994 RepID=UPI00086D5028|nr:hypothetical protein PBN151_5737 [Paenibacillus sp. NAIST15-1]
MKKDLLEQLNLWHEEDEFEKIVGKIAEIPEQDRDYDIVGYLARALNNLKRYDEALQQLSTIKTQGENDFLWHFRVGYAYYYLSQYEDAVAAFEIANKLDPEDEDTSTLLTWSRREVGLTDHQEKSETVQPNAIDSVKNDIEANERLEQEKDFGFAQVYAVELKYKQPPMLDRNILYEKMELYTGKVDRGEHHPDSAGLAVWEANSQEDQNLLHFFHLNYMVEYTEGEMPAQTSLMDTESRPVADYESAIQQSWHWREAAQVVSDCEHSLLLIDMMASGLDPKSRLQLFTGSLRAVLETAPCDAIYFRESDKLVEPSAYLAAIEEGELLYGALNIRFYNVEGTGSGRPEGLMDSLGLVALGIPDVQCHYYDLEPDEVAGNLLNIAYYLFDRGDVIADGETIGFTEEMRWRCEHQYGLAAPHRVVIDIDPGEPYYAGSQGAEQS